MVFEDSEPNPHSGEPAPYRYRLWAKEPNDFHRNLKGAAEFLCRTCFVRWVGVADASDRSPCWHCGEAVLRPPAVSYARPAIPMTRVVSTEYPPLTS